MKRFSVLLMTLLLWASPALRAQDAATQERLDKLSGSLEDVIASQKALQNRLDSLSKDLESVREAANRPVGNFAAQEDLKRVADALKEVDRKRLEDYEKIGKELHNLSKVLATPAPTPKPAPAVDKEKEKENSKPQEGFEYIVQKGDSLSIIAQAYREQKKLKVTAEQILKANPGLKAEKLRVGQKVFIPAQ